MEIHTVKVKRKDTKNKWLFHHLTGGQVFEIIRDDENVFMRIEPTNMNPEDENSFDNAVNLLDGSLIYVGTHEEVIFHDSAAVHVNEIRIKNNKDKKQ